MVHRNKSPLFLNFDFLGKFGSQNLVITVLLILSLSQQRPLF